MTNEKESSLVQPEQEPNDWKSKLAKAGKGLVKIIARAGRALGKAIVKEINTLVKTLSLLIIGLGIGWLAGLSVSPVVSTIITAVVGVAITLVSILGGLQTQKAQSGEKSDSQTSPSGEGAKSKLSPLWPVNPFPIACFIFGIMIGSGAGIYTRSHNLLGMDLFSEIEKWRVAGINEQEVVRRLFDREYPTKKPAKQETGQVSIDQSVLFGRAHKECERLLSYSRDDLPMQLEISTIEIFNDLPEIIQDLELLEKVVKAQCEKLGQ